MKKFSSYRLNVCLCIFFSALTFGVNVPASVSSQEASIQLNAIYHTYCNTPSDINEHIPHLRRLSQECSSVVEIGIRDVVSTWGLLQGLAESTSPNRKYTGVDLRQPPSHALQLAQRLATDNGISFEFVEGNDMTLDLGPMDLLFIDSLHTYCHLTYELEKFSPMVQKYIAMHDTSAPWGDRNDDQYWGDYSEYPEWFDRTKAGLWPAVEDFLSRHPEWQLKERHLNNHGFTILMRTPN